MVDRELIDAVVRQAINHVHDPSQIASPFQLKIVHQLLDEMSGQAPQGTADNTVKTAIRDEIVARVRRSRGLPPQRG